MEKVGNIDKELQISTSSVFLIKKIGEGAYSEVWKGSYEIENIVAVKVITTTSEDVCISLLLSLYFFIYLSLFISLSFLFF